jgi:hypothetical protein
VLWHIDAFRRVDLAPLKLRLTREMQAVGKDSIAVATKIMTVWKIPREQLQQSCERPGIVMFPLPSEIREVVDRFDHGFLPDHQGQVDQLEVRHLGELARAMPMPVKHPKEANQPTPPAIENTSGYLGHHGNKGPRKHLEAR